MKYKNLLVLLLVNLNQSFLPAAQESKIQDEPFVIVPFEQLVESTIKNYPGINQTFTFLQEKHLVNQSFRQFLQTELASDEDENDKRGANFDEVLDQAHEIIAANMKDQFIAALNITLNKNKTLDEFHDPIILYVMQHKDDSMRDMVHHWLYEWSTTEDDDGCVPLYRAALKNNLEIAHLLIAAGVNLNPINNRGDTPLYSATSRDRPEIAHLLIDAGANLNLQNHIGCTPLHSAISRNRLEIAHLLINAGANLNLQNYIGRTPLYRANAKKSRMLIDAKADVNIKDNTGKSPLHYALNNEVAKILISAGAHINLQDNLGWTPLHVKVHSHGEIIASRLRIYRNNIGIVCTLMSAGADLTIQNNNGLTAEQVASTPEMQIIFMRTRIQKALSCTIS